MLAQVHEMSCGVACARQLLNDFEIEVLEDEFRRVSKFSEDTGSRAKDLAAALNHFDNTHNYRGGGIDPDDLPRVLKPCLVLLKLESGSHWVLLDAVGAKTVELRDLAPDSTKPGVGSRIVLDNESFAERWRQTAHGVVFCLRK